MFVYDTASGLSGTFTTENFILLVVFALVNTTLLCYIARKFMQITQQSGYVNSEYRKWVRRRENVYIVRLGMVVMLSVLSYLIFSIAFSFGNADWVAPCGFAFYLVFVVVYILSDMSRKSKTPLVMTSRVIRLYATFALLTLIFNFALLCGLAALGALVYTNDILFRVRFCPMTVTPLTVPVFVSVANALNSPAERAISRKYVQKCKETLAARDDLIKIGVTGSYGKTSVKEILRTILSEKYNVLVTPFSYNTPLGICRAVKKLDDTYDVFIAEMGARHEGDIRELCDIVNPTFGVINGIVEQHLETFQSLEKIKKTKFELVDRLRENGGSVVITCDNENTLSMLGELGGVSVTLAGLDTSYSPEVYAENVKLTRDGTEFTLCFKDGKYECYCPLYGRHNVSNVVLAAAMAEKLGLTHGEIVAGIARLKPIKHRLEVSFPDNGVTVIDDSYNSNVDGTKAAVEVMNSFAGRKIIVTPGMVELGRIENRENYEFGRRLASVVDKAVLVGSHGAYSIRDGLLSEGFPLENIFMAKDLNDAMAHYRKTYEKGDVVLFENDLPDKFS